MNTLVEQLDKLADLRKCLGHLGEIKAKIGHNGAKKVDFVSCGLYDGLRITWGEEYGESTATSRALADFIADALNLDFAALRAAAAAPVVEAKPERSEVDEKVLAAIRANSETHEGIYISSKSAKRLLKMIDAAPSIATEGAAGWVMVEDGLPKDRNEYWVWMMPTDGSPGYAEVSRLNSSLTGFYVDYDDNGTVPLEVVTHYMPYSKPTAPQS